MKVGQHEVEELGRLLEGKSALEILSLVSRASGPRVAILSSMQRAGSVLCHLADRAGLAMDVLFVDTGVLHRETLEARDQLIATHPHLRVKTLSPTASFEEQTHREGILYLTKEGQERCCELRKSEPLHAVRGTYDVVVSALRREEGGRRGAVPRVAIDRELGALRVHPLVDWSKDELAAYSADHPDLVVHKLHLWGYPTIGCFPCTTPVRPDEPERAGRWRHLADVTYCGINPTDRGDPSALASMELDDRVAKLFALARASA